MSSGLTRRRGAGGGDNNGEDGQNESSAERSKQPKLTLMEEVLLLGLKDKQVSAA
jgi:hypothetical protein